MREGEEALDALRSGGKPALARALAELERRPEAEASLALLDAAAAAPRGHVVGVTGPPGVGKSSLLRVLIGRWRAAGRRVAVIAVDPSSKRSGGALLGDRIRLQSDPADADLFVRSMAARDRLGGLAELSIAAAVVMRALYDVVLVETVGVGQSETEIAGLADTVVFCVQPASGDSLQFMKAGVVEIPHVAVVTKADLGAPAKRALVDLKGALGLAFGAEAERAAALAVSSSTGEGIETLIEALDSRFDALRRSGGLEAAREAQAAAWIEAAVRHRFGSDGWQRGGPATAAERARPFRAIGARAAALTAWRDRAGAATPA